jgi:predicted DNA-binding transcriptional regulator YafY
MSEIDRLYQYKTLLSSRRVMSREDILNKLEISLATFKRDIAKLRDQLHTPSVFDRDLGGYRIEQTDSTELPGMWFSQDEMLALMTIQSMIVQLEPGLLGPKLKPFQATRRHAGQPRAGCCHLDPASTRRPCGQTPPAADQL